MQELSCKKYYSFFFPKKALKNVGQRNSGEIMSQMQIAISTTTEEHYENNSESSPPLTGYREKDWLEHEQESA